MKLCTHQEHVASELLHFPAAAQAVAFAFASQQQTKRELDQPAAHVELDGPFELPLMHLPVDAHHPQPDWSVHEVQSLWFSQHDDDQPVALASKHRPEVGELPHLQRTKQYSNAEKAFNTDGN